MYLLDARKAATSAMSMGSPKSPRGICDMKPSLICGTGSENRGSMIYAHLVRHNIGHGCFDEPG